MKALAAELWGGTEAPSQTAVRSVGKGGIVWGGDITRVAPDELYPSYPAISAILDGEGASPDFIAGSAFRYTHRTLPDKEIYFVSNRTASTVTEMCRFREGTRAAELWDAVTGEIRPLAKAIPTGRGIALELRLEPWQSCFIVFDKEERAADKPDIIRPDFPDFEAIMTFDGPWRVAFDPAWGGPRRAAFGRLEDWSKRPESGIRHYSGIATYSRSFNIPQQRLGGGAKLFLDLGTVRELARVRLNGKDLGVLWTAPWRVEITEAVRPGGNRLEIDVANLWPNRLIGDEELPDDGIKGGRWPDWLLDGTPRTSGRFTFTTHRYYKKGDPLLPSGLLGPVTIVSPAAGVR